MRRSVIALAAIFVSLAAPSTALATDAEIRQGVTDGSARIVEQEQKVTAIAQRFGESKRPSAALVRRFRAAAREEEAVVRDIGATLAGLTPETEPVGRGRDLMTKGLQRVATGLDRIEKALGRLQRGGSPKANARSIAKAEKELLRGNALIEQGEPLVGAELTPATPAPAAGTPS